jgi:uncharacterized integral membrane protein
VSDDVERESGPVTPRRVAAAVLVVVVVAFVLDNREEVPVGYVFGERSTPLIVVLVAVFLAGLAVGWLSGRRGRR